MFGYEIGSGVIAQGRASDLSQQVLRREARISVSPGVGEALFVDAVCDRKPWDCPPSSIVSAGLSLLSPFVLLFRRLQQSGSSFPSESRTVPEICVSPTCLSCSGSREPHIHANLSCEGHAREPQRPRIEASLTGLFGGGGQIDSLLQSRKASLRFLFPLLGRLSRFHLAHSCLTTGVPVRSMQDTSLPVSALVVCW
ncbi:hypothetical protein VTN00DRAFT_6006 [Thermoascus crustaceus]|uniref:uncharacterized protein n=1 Tax=Thermoascus crustaceus TaxID=5088 RepID=UPI0037421F73